MNMSTAGFSPYTANSSGAGLNFPGVPGGDLGMSPAAGSSPAAAAPRTVVGQPLSWFVGAVLFWIAWKFLGEHEGNSINPAHIRIGGYNLVAVGLSWVLFWTLSKLVVNRWFGQSSVATFVNWLG